MVMQSLRSGASGGFGKFLLFGILAMAAAGLVFMDVRGVLTGGGVGGNDVVKVEDKVISVQEFDSTLRRTLSKYQISPQQAYKLGLIDEVLSAEVRSRFLEIEAENAGIEIGKNAMQKKIAEVVRPQMQEGQTLQQTLDSLLRYQQISEQQFVTSVKREMSTEILTDTVRIAFSPNTDRLAQDLLAFQQQTRDIEIVTFPDESIESVEPPSEDQLRNLYEAFKMQDYKIPETRQVQALVLDPETLEFDVSVSQEEVKEAYEEHKESFKLGEQLVLTQIVVQDPTVAQDVAAAVNDGKSLEAATVDVMGSDQKLIKNVPFEIKMMMPSLKKALAEKEIGKVVGPVKSQLGHHVVRLEDILAPTYKPLSAVRQQLETELLQIKKSDYFYELSLQIDDMLEDRREFTEIQSTIDAMEIYNPAPITRDGTIAQSAEDQSAENEKGLNFLEGEDRTAALQTIYEMSQDEPVSYLQELPSGTFVAFRLVDVTPSDFKPFSDVRSDIEEQYYADQRRIKNLERIQSYLSQLEDGNTTLSSIAKETGHSVDTVTDIPVAGEAPAPVTKQTRPKVFQTALGDYGYMALDGQAALFKVSGYDLPDMSEETLQIVTREIQPKVNEEMQEEAVLMYLQYLNGKYDAKVNRALLDRVYNQDTQN